MTVHTPEELAAELAKRIPRLIHAGTYALYETPDGGRHLVYRRTQELGDSGPVDLSEPVDQHLPDIPPQALPLIEAWLQNGFPPAVLAMLDGKLNPLSVLKAMRDGPG